MNTEHLFNILIFLANLAFVVAASNKKIEIKASFGIFSATLCVVAFGLIELYQPMLWNIAFVFAWINTMDKNVNKFKLDPK